MNLQNIKNIHIIGIGGCASSAIAEFLIKNNLNVSGSEMKHRNGLEYLEKLNIKINYSHQKENLLLNGDYPDVVLYSPAVMALDPNNPELIEAKNRTISLVSWQNFIGDYLNSLGKVGITVSGSEGKGTTAGILTTILKGSDFDPLSILGAKIKKINNGDDSNIYLGYGKSYILEGDEYNKNFHSYHPSINIMVNFQYEHPETYKNFDEYQSSFYHFFNGMNNPKKLILNATKNIVNFVDKFKINDTHKIVWYGKKENLKELKAGNDFYEVDKVDVSQNGIAFTLTHNNKDFNFKVNSLPQYLVYNATGAIIAAFELGLAYETIRDNLLNFKGMVRRFDVYKTKGCGAFITDYGHSPEAINHIISEVKTIFKDKKLHTVFQPHLYSRTYNFLNEFGDALTNSDRVTLVDIYPAREKESDWKDKISIQDLFNKIKEKKDEVFLAGKSSEIYETLTPKIDEREVTLFIGAGDIDLYYPKIFEKFEILE